VDGDPVEDAAVVRAAVDGLRDNPQWTSTMLPTRTGLVCATLG
jgi:hypothetical protein